MSRKHSVTITRKWFQGGMHNGTVLVPLDFCLAVGDLSRGWFDFVCNWFVTCTNQFQWRWQVRRDYMFWWKRCFTPRKLCPKSYYWGQYPPLNICQPLAWTPGKVRFPLYQMLFRQFKTNSCSFYSTENPGIVLSTFLVYLLHAKIPSVLWRIIYCKQ